MPHLFHLVDSDLFQKVLFRCDLRFLVYFLQEWNAIVSFGWRRQSFYLADFSKIVFLDEDVTGGIPIFAQVWNRVAYVHPEQSELLTLALLCSLALAFVFTLNMQIASEVAIDFTTYDIKECAIEDTSATVFLVYFDNCTLDLFVPQEFLLEVTSRQSVNLGSVVVIAMLRAVMHSSSQVPVQKPLHKLFYFVLKASANAITHILTVDKVDFIRQILPKVEVA